MTLSGIYQIQSKAKPERIYIGSAINIRKRWSGHLLDLRSANHGNSKLQNHFNKYGESDLVFSVLLGCEKEDLIIHEQFFIDTLNPFFNICKVAGNRQGVKATDETKRKMSESKKGIPKSDEIRKRMSVWLIGHKGCVHSEESKRRISEGHMGLTTWSKGLKLPEEIRIKMSNARKGMKFSDEHKKNISKSQLRNKHSLGHRQTDDHKNKVIAKLIGRPVSDETKHKIAESNRLNKNTPEGRIKMQKAWELRRLKKRVA